MKLFGGQQQHKRSFTLVVIGLSCLSLGILILALDPLQLVVDYKLTMRPGSFIYKLWEKPPLDVFISVYLFNITNLDRFLEGLDPKIKVEEVGPYVYQEILENRNATFNENNTISFRPHRKVEFIRDKSVGDPMVDMVIVPNIPYMGVTTAASKLSILAAMAIRTLMTTMKSEIVFNMSVHDYLWGYDDPLVRLASKLIPEIITFDTFGLLDRMFDEGENLVSMNLPSKRPIHHKSPSPVAERQVMEPEDEKSYSDILTDLFSFTSSEQVHAKLYEPNVRDFSIDTWNGNTGLSYWGYKEGEPGNSECNVLRGTYDGTLFPRNISKGETFRVYRKSFCRTLPIEYSHPGTVDGIDAYFFKLADNAFDSDLEDSTSSCFCTKKVCLKKGLGNVTPCYYNIPAAISFPHFYNADPSLLSGVEGLSPSEEKHGSEIVLQPQLGIPMKVHSRFQINLLMGDVKFNSVMRKFHNTVLPIMWIEIAINELPGDLLFLLQLLFNIAPIVQVSLIYTLVLIGTSIMGLAGLMYFCVSSPRPPHEFMPKKDVKYSAIYMFPYIRKEIAKLKEDEDSCLTTYNS